MKPWLKLTLYLVLSAMAVWLAYGFVQGYRASTRAASQPAEADPDARRTVHDVDAQHRMAVCGFAGFVCLAALGFLLSRDVSRWFAHQATDFLYNDNAVGVHNPDYDHAEQMALQGDYMEAIRLLREFLGANPREIYAQIRIAEIYENELKNYLAAALEYEEVLKHQFNADRWGWAAIHLTNLYSGKLDKPDLALAWLRRIAEETPNTGPASKARERLGLPDPADEPIEPPASGSGGLPPGFSPKKR